MNDSYKVLNTSNLQDVFMNSYIPLKLTLIKIRMMFISSAIIEIFLFCKEETEGLQESGLDVHKNKSINPTPLCTSA